MADEGETILAGPATDRRVAVEMLGWARDHLGDPIDTLCHTMPAFSTDLAAAWLLVEPLLARWGQFHLSRYPNGRWVCASRDAYARNTVLCVEEVAETAPLAICRAALATVDRASDRAVDRA